MSTTREEAAPPRAQPVFSYTERLAQVRKEMARSECTHGMEAVEPIFGYPQDVAWCSRCRLYVPSLLQRYLDAHGQS